MNGTAKNKASAATLLYYYIYKPYGILSQFSPEGEYLGLGEVFSFPEDVYPVGRLDADSEGLLILTNDTNLNYQLLNPKQEHWRTYWVQVEGEVTAEAIQQLKKGVSIRIQKKDYTTLPADAGILTEDVPLAERNPPVRFRKSIPTSWIYLRLREGKNRQVRRMTAAVGFPTLRLVRVAIEDLKLEGMQAGDVREVPKELLYKLLKIQAKPSPAKSGSFDRARGARNFKKR